MVNIKETVENLRKIPNDGNKYAIREYTGPESYTIERQLVFDNGQTYSDTIVIYDDGAVVIMTDWGSFSYFDRWFFSPAGQLRYTGTVSGYRAMPSWVAIKEEEDA